MHQYKACQGFCRAIPHSAQEHAILFSTQQVDMHYSFIVGEQCHFFKHPMPLSTTMFLNPMSQYRFTQPYCCFMASRGHPKAILQDSCFPCVLAIVSLRRISTDMGARPSVPSIASPTIGKIPQT